MQNLDNAVEQLRVADPDDAELAALSVELESRQRNLLDLRRECDDAAAEATEAADVSMVNTIRQKVNFLIGINTGYQNILRRMIAGQRVLGHDPAEAA